MADKTATELMQLFWKAQRERGDTPRRLYGLVSLGGGMQPKGYVISWGLLRDYVEMIQARLGDADKWEIQEFEPTCLRAHIP